MNIMMTRSPSPSVLPARPFTPTGSGVFPVTCGTGAGPVSDRRRPVARWWRGDGRWVARRWRAVRGAAAEAGMSTAEYAVGTVAACAFAAVLYKVVTSPAVSSALGAMIKKALGVAV